MEIYRYKIWTGNIPGKYTPPCEDKKLVGARRNAPQPPNNQSDCEACSDLGNASTIIDACLDCWNGMLNPCCPDKNTNCCGLIIDDCEKLHAMDIEKQNEYCLNCYNSKHSLKGSKDTLELKAARKALSSTVFNDPLNLCKCCNRTGRVSNDSMLSIFLEQDLNDIGHYSMWDGEMEQDDTFSNFTVVGDTTNPYIVSLKNSTEFRFFKFLENIQYTIDWGDPLVPIQTISAPLDTAIATYPNPGVYTINVRMEAPWGTSSFSHQVAVPFQTGADLWAGVANTGQTYTFIPPGFSTPVSMDYEFSDWGPLDSGLDIHGYMTANYGSTPYLVNGVTQSMITSLQSYNTGHTIGLPPGYTQGNTVVVAGQVLMPDGSYVDNLTGQIDWFTSVATGYTITNGTEVFTMMDHINGETVFEVQGYGMNVDDFLTRKCGFALQGVCDVCNVDQIYFDGSSYITQSVNTDRGEWDSLEDYDIGDYVYYDGCCFFAINQILAGGNPPDLLDSTSIFWRVCHDSCVVEDSLPSRYMCIDGTCILISPTSSYYNSANFIGSPPTTANALSDCISSPCTPTGGPVMHYECDNGACVQVAPGAGNYGTCTYQGATALSLCQADVLAGICNNNSGGIKYNCVYDSTLNDSSCHPSPGGFYPDITSCQNACGGSGNVYDWYCSEETTAGPDGTLNTADDVLINVCRGVAVGSPVPANATTGVAYPTYSDCQSNCISNNELWFCMCNITQDGAQVPGVAAPGQFGGQYCINWPSAPSGLGGGFATQFDCENNCLSWECDEGTGNCSGYNAGQSFQGQYCAEGPDLPFHGQEITIGGPPNSVNIPGCDAQCDEPSTHMCITGGGNLGTCTELTINDTTCINPNHVLLGGTCIDWDTANAWNGVACNDIGLSTCIAPLSQQCGQGCGPCAANPSTEAPFVAYSATTPYMFYDTVISYQYNGSTQDSMYKYFYDPSPVCDDTIGNTGLIQWGINPLPQNWDCSPGSFDMTTCESDTTNPAQDHPCMNTVGMVCNNPPLQNVPPPVTQAESRLSSGTCWAPCQI